MCCTINITYPEDPARVVLVVGDAAAAQSSLGHDRVEAGIVLEGVASAASWWLHEGVDGSVATVLLLNLPVNPASPPESQPTGYGE